MSDDVKPLTEDNPNGRTNMATEKGEFSIGNGRDLFFSRTPASAPSQPVPGVTIRIGEGRCVYLSEVEWRSINEWLGYDRHDDV